MVERTFSKVIIKFVFKLFITCKNKYDFLNSGHHHYDNLSIDLSINRKNVVTDPGSFVYTSDIEKRKKFKGFQSHFVPFFKEFELNQDKDSVFNCNFFFKYAIGNAIIIIIYTKLLLTFLLLTICINIRR